MSCVGRHDVVVAREHDRHAGLVERGGVTREPLEPGELVVEFRPGLRVAVRRIERSDQHAVDRGLDVAALGVVRIARQLGARDDRHHAARQDRDAVPGLLAAPHRLVAGLAQRVALETRGRVALSSCRQHDVGLRACAASRAGSAGARRMLLMLKLAIRMRCSYPRAPSCATGKSARRPPRRRSRGWQ